MKATAVAPSNIAWVKYWGRRNDALVLPTNSNFSMTFGPTKTNPEGMHTTTTVEFSDAFDMDTVIIDGKEADRNAYDRTVAHLNIIRGLAGVNYRFKMESRNNFPYGAGFASSASGGAAEAYAASEALGLRLSKEKLSVLARLSGSGSAARSVHGGWVMWQKGEREDGEDSHAIRVFDENHWPDVRVLATVLDDKVKGVRSAEGMKESVESCPLYALWPSTAESDLKRLIPAIERRDFSTAGLIAEYNCRALHAIMLATREGPKDRPLIYFAPETIALMKQVHAWRAEGLEAYYTIDAGPNVKVICMKEDEATLTDRLKSLPFVKNVIPTQPGPGARLADEHLF